MKGDKENIVNKQRRFSIFGTGGQPAQRRKPGRRSMRPNRRPTSKKRTKDIIQQSATTSFNLEDIHALVNKAEKKSRSSKRLDEQSSIVGSKIAMIEKIDNLKVSAVEKERALMDANAKVEELENQLRLQDEKNYQQLENISVAHEAEMSELDQKLEELRLQISNQKKISLDRDVVIGEKDLIIQNLEARKDTQLESVPSLAPDMVEYLKVMSDQILQSESIINNFQQIDAM
eukprot:TRINITY_DN12410_c0_g1_i1.p1 TRINITY_DN12410_c0_g1~~TRINITY_DN12410_c0_g1_i1.p1  ORF type:complete len:232 (-),score=68.16 TRINITY_DN12410_c0_g1_i1:109-804(-)